MPDPLSLIALGAAVGGATGKFVEKAWDSGEKWLKTYFANHRVKAQEKAKENSAIFINELSRRIKNIEDESGIDSKIIDDAQNHPGFSVLLQKSILNAAQTDNFEKHELLAELVSSRLLQPSEGTFALASKMACDAITHATPRQLTILGLIEFLQEVRLTKFSLTTQQYQNWLEKCLEPIMIRVDIFNNRDLLHLEALSCITYERGSNRGLEPILQTKNGPIMEATIEWKDRFDQKLFKNSEIGIWLNYLWTEGMAGVYVTSVGAIVGKCVNDKLSGIVTQHADWPT